MTRARSNVALALLALVVLLTSSLHMALVSHAVCHAHGELVHGDDDHQRGVERSAHEDEAGPAASTGDDDEHEHCAGMALEEAVLSEAHPALLAILDALAIQEPHTIAAELSSRRRLLLAPKTSPPRPRFAFPSLS
jgi:hypothetical protein